MPRLKMKMSKGFTIINNTILRDSSIGSSPRGTYVTMLSMADGWNFTVRGLAKIMGEGVTKISNSLHVLEEKHYLKRVRVYENGRIVDWDYYLYDEPYPFDTADDKGSKPATQDSDLQDTDILDTENLNQVIQDFEKQYAYKRTNKEKSIKEISCEEESIDQSASNSDKAVTNAYKSDGSTDGYAKDQKIYTDIVKENIGFYDLSDWLGDEEEAEEIVQMIVRQICSKKPSEHICSQDFPREVVKSAMLKVDIIALENAIEQIKQTDNVRNYEKYLISTLFNEANGRHFKENSEARWADFAVKRDFGE